MIFLIQHIQLTKSAMKIWQLILQYTGYDLKSNMSYPVTCTWRNGVSIKLDIKEIVKELQKPGKYCRSGRVFW